MTQEYSKSLQERACKEYSGAHVAVAAKKHKPIGLSFLAINLRRAINMVGIEGLLAVI